MVAFFVRMWRKNARLRLLPPLPWILKRFAALYFVLSLGMSTPF